MLYFQIALVLNLMYWGFCNALIARKLKMVFGGVLRIQTLNKTWIRRLMRMSNTLSKSFINAYYTIPVYLCFCHLMFIHLEFPTMDAIFLLEHCTSLQNILMLLLEIPFKDVMGHKFSGNLFL